MRRLFALSLLLLPFLNGTADAAQNQPTVDPRFCQALVKHTPSADVSYQPGVDVQGRPVVPADLDDSAAAAIPQEFTIPLTADLFSFLGVDKAAFPYNTMGRTDIQLGTLTVRGDKVLMNGKPLTNAQQDNLAVLCMRPSTGAANAPVDLKAKN